jgi:hypothetical protein
MQSLYRNHFEKSSRSREIQDENLARKTTIYAKTALYKDILIAYS